ncbi:transcription factor HES-5-like [Melanotaenia boesemani]|uniref:transcription factor HES-5-like n=1 Tax=Melanotaenia boesemani TaxID=1250792 RepID=UPI001C0584E7|nr:transcription factor HES-5-like [Melanotaenia boesemani]
MEIWVYKYRAEAQDMTVQTLLALQTEQKRSDSTAMAPTVFGHPSKDHLTPAHKLRKPMVEKLRRDRINTSIEQLKSLLGPEFLKQQPDSKQEKADILEMAVSYLRSWQQQKQQQSRLTSGVMTAGDGYSHCVQEAVSFLTHCEVQTQAHRLLLSHFQGLQASNRTNLRPCTLSPPASPLRHLSSSKGVNPASSAVWRPW